jgi:hypothetical protein
MNHAEILADIRSAHPDYPQSNLTLYMKELTSEDRGSVVKRGLDGSFRFSEPLYYAYAQGLFRTPSVSHLSNLLSKLFTTSLNYSVHENVHNWLNSTTTMWQSSAAEDVRPPD